MENIQQVENFRSKFKANVNEVAQKFVHFLVKTCYKEVKANFYLFYNSYSG